MPKNLLKRLSITMFAFFAVYAGVIVSAYHVISADLVLMDTLWYDAVDLLMQWAEIIGTALIISFLIFSVYRFGIADCRSLFCLMGGALLFKYVAAVIALSIVYGSFDVTQDYTGYVVSLLIEAGLAAVAVYFTDKFAVTYIKENRAKENAARALGIEPEIAAPLLPFRKTFDAANPLQRTVMIVMGAYAAMRLISFIISDIAYSMMGATFTAADIPVMLIYWILQIFIPCFVGYLLINFTLRILNRKF